VGLDRPKGGLGPKFERAMVSEIVGIGAEWRDDYRARGVRRDPLEIRAAVKVLKNADRSWKVAAEKEKGATEPSKINHSSVPFDSQNAGVTIECAEQTTTLSLICLRRLRFPVNGTPTAEVEAVARTTLAVLGLCAATLAFESGIGLRSRCLLWPDGLMMWELLDRPGDAPKTYSLSSNDAVKLLEASINAAKAAKLPWVEQPILLKPSAEVVKLVRLSQLEATKEESDPGGK
jgi:CRISPR-associated protein Csb1